MGQNAKVATEPGEPLQAEEATRYRARVARLNDLALHRPDVQYAVKEAAKLMSAPCAHGWKLLTRLGRYLVGAPSAVQAFVWQDTFGELVTDVDSDCA